MSQIYSKYSKEQINYPAKTFLFFGSDLKPFSREFKWMFYKNCIENSYNFYGKNECLEHLIELKIHNKIIDMDMMAKNDGYVFILRDSDEILYWDKHVIKKYKIDTPIVSVVCLMNTIILLDIYGDIIALDLKFNIYRKLTNNYIVQISHMDRMSCLILDINGGLHILNSCKIAKIPTDKKISKIIGYYENIIMFTDKNKYVSFSLMFTNYGLNKESSLVKDEIDMKFFNSKKFHYSNTYGSLSNMFNYISVNENKLHLYDKRFYSYSKIDGFEFYRDIPKLLIFCRNFVIKNKVKYNKENLDIDCRKICSFGLKFISN